jgi:hypothetical protein
MCPRATGAWDSPDSDIGGSQFGWLGSNTRSEVSSDFEGHFKFPYIDFFTII